MWYIDLFPRSAAYMCQWIKFGIGSDNGMLPIRHKGIIQTYAGLFSLNP